MHTRLSNKLAALSAILVALLVATAVASAQEPVLGNVHVTNRFGQPAARLNGQLVITHTDGSREIRDTWTDEHGDAGIYAEPGATATVTFRGQAIGQDGTWDTTGCPGYVPPQTQITVTLSGDEIRDHWTAQAPVLVPQLTDPGMDPSELRFVNLVNAERVAAGLNPLAESGLLAAAADAHSTAQTTIRGIAPHYGADCEAPGVRYAELGGRESMTFMIRGEVTTAVVCSPEAALASFKSSPAHWQNLMGTAGLIGVAQVDGVWTALLGAGTEEPAYPLPSLPRHQPSGACTDSGRGHSGGAPPRDIVTPVKRASFRGLTAKRHGRKLIITGALRPHRRGERVTVKLAQKTVRTRTHKGGHFRVSLRARTRLHRGAKVRVAVRAHHGVFKAARKTVRVR